MEKVGGESMNSLTALSPFVGLMGASFSTGVSSYAEYQTALANNYSKQWSAIQDRAAADLASTKADTYRALGQQERFETEQEYDALRSRQRAEYSAAGVDVGTGSALTQQVATVRQGVYEGQKAQYERDLQAWEMDTQAANLRLSAQVNENSMQNPWYPAITSGITGLTNIYSQYGQRTQGVSNNA